MMWWYGGSPWMAIGGGLMMVLFWGGLIVLAVWLVRGTGRGPQPLDPMETLKRRLASGEINQEQFEQTRKALQG
jgi:putative membrane protein